MIVQTTRVGLSLFHYNIENWDLMIPWFLRCEIFPFFKRNHDCVVFAVWNFSLLQTQPIKYRTYRQCHAYFNVVIAIGTTDDVLVTHQCTIVYFSRLAICVVDDVWMGGLCCKQWVLTPTDAINVYCKQLVLTPEMWLVQNLMALRTGGPRGGTVRKASHVAKNIDFLFSFL